MWRKENKRDKCVHFLSKLHQLSVRWAPPTHSPLSRNDSIQSMIHAPAHLIPRGIDLYFPKSKAKQSGQTKHLSYSITHSLCLSLHITFSNLHLTSSIGLVLTHFMATRLPPFPPQPPPPPPSPPQQMIITPPRTCTVGVATCSPLCPNLCSPPSPATYNYYPDDPSATPGGSSSPALSPLLIALISILAAAFLLVSYYVLSTSSFFRGSRGSGSSDPTIEESQSQSQPLDPNTGLGESLISRIALLKYRKNDGLVVSTDCSVCLGEFKEDESLRLLPECTHAFHVECIDKWLEAHSNCPICRTSVISVPQPVQAHVVPRVQPRERDTRANGNDNGNINGNNATSNVRNGGGNNEISNSNPPLIREERRGGGLVVIVDPGPVGRVQEIIEVGNDSIRPVSRQPMVLGREIKPVKSSLMR